MTRAEIIAYATAQLGITDSAAVTQAGTILDRWWAVIWNAFPWRQTRNSQALAVSANTQDYALSSDFDAVKVCRWAGRNEVLPTTDEAELATDPAGYDAGGSVERFVILPRSSNVMQLRLVRIPQESGTLLVIGKKKLVVLAGGDTPPIPGADMALCEFVLGDLYRWIRQHQTAEAYFAKGRELLTAMGEIEVQQSGAIHRIVPQEQVLGGGGMIDSSRPLG